MIGVTHVLLPSCDIELVRLLPAMLRILAPTLVVLDISHNSFTHLPIELKQCMSLEELNISSNPMRLIPSFIGTLYSLRQLQMDHCTIHTLPSEMQDLANLHTLCRTSTRTISGLS
jgi:Leucine-rich repeat (LRR) protein